ncbi:APC family permease [Azohydromonas aeria]|uniref:APC family permease n=1 Tax=Azohydromonas aeria TaxID=2590212 RepID=UPI001E2BC95E|nr:APC family permease [Azohydromonas aeria]
MTSDTPSPAEPRALLRLRDAVALTVGLVIGAGIFKAPALVASLAGGTGWMFAAWVLGGLLSLVGALCYAELATAYPNAGGDYHFLRRAWGRNVAFLFAWARMAVITTGSIALLGFVFGDYMQQLLPLGRHGAAWWAAAAVLALTLVNARGLRTGVAAQGWLTAIEVGALLLVVGAGLFLLVGDGGAPAAAPAPADGGAGAPAPWSLSGFGLAMVFVLLTYGGWNEAAYVSAEVRDRRRDMARALVLSITLITALYLLVVWAYWHGLGLAGMAGSQGIAADLLRVAFGDAGGTLVAIAVAVAALTSMNATLIVGARSTWAAGRDWPLLARLGRWDAARGTPPVALALQGGAALALVAVGSAAGSGFKAMVEFTAPVFWLFFLLTGLALFVLRRREPGVERPFRVPLYPLLPLLFCTTCAYMLWSSLSYVYSQQFGGFNAAWIGVAVLLAGALLLPLLRAPAAAPPASPASPSDPAPARRCP